MAALETPTNSDDREWLEADGLGGFASARADGTRSRRYHNLLCTATQPPAERVALVAAVEAWLTLDGERIPLSTNTYAGDVAYPDARALIREFQHAPWPRWKFEVAKGVFVEHEIFVPRGRSAVVMTWRLSKPRANCTLEVRPLLSGRELHGLHRENREFDFRTQAVADGVRWQQYGSLPAVQGLANGRFDLHPEWYRNFLYSDERARGFEHVEDLASPGTFTFDFAAGEAQLVLGTEAALVEIRAADGPLSARIGAWRRAEKQRREKFQDPLSRAADAYIVARGSGLTIVAGYPWFGDWGRDTFIAMRGMCLAGGRLDDALAILLEWSQHVSEGMLPNRFPDAGGEAEYNSVDSSLWYVIGVHDLLQTFVRQNRVLSRAHANRLWRAVEQILDGYLSGTRYRIGADSDGLLRAGEPGVQLTWMDALVDGRVITPRTGKPVEIQALWLNALWIGAQVMGRFALEFDRGSRSFEARFWNEERGCLYDVVDCDHVPGVCDGSVRPNQLLAIGGLPLQLLAGKRARSVVDVVEQQLWTSMGPRSLEAQDGKYVGRYEGGPLQRDSAYHQGTVWPWMSGPFVEAWVRARGDTAAARLSARKKFLEPMLAHLETAGLGHVSEIADGDAPHQPRGCPFQAWSVGELMRLDKIVLAPINSKRTGSSRAEARTSRKVRTRRR